ncbi:omptin family outer membrane protease [Erwinia sp. V71]|uniref:omptin family outer membrane protease n=1 Tax=Erwinia sp. V71 TaxID=3369424 RepID=UPI003F610BF4
MFIYHTLTGRKNGSHRINRTFPKLFTTLSYNRYAEAKASTEMIDHDNGSAEKSPGDNAGIANTHYSAAIGLQYVF